MSSVVQKKDKIEKLILLLKSREIFVRKNREESCFNEVSEFTRALPIDHEVGAKKRTLKHLEATLPVQVFALDKKKKNALPITG